MDHLITAFICPYQEFSTKAVVIKSAEDFDLAPITTCPSPLKGKNVTVVSVGQTVYVPYVLWEILPGYIYPDGKAHN